MVDKTKVGIAFFIRNFTNTLQRLTGLKRKLMTVFNVRYVATLQNTHTKLLRRLQYQQGLREAPMYRKNNL